MHFYQVDCEGEVSSIAHLPFCARIFYLMMVE